MRVIKGLLWPWENVEKQISCLALSLRMIKNKVNPVAAEGTSSCEGGRERRKGERGRREEEKGWRSSHTKKTRHCLLISGVEWFEEL